MSDTQPPLPDALPESASQVDDLVAPMRRAFGPDAPEEARTAAVKALAAMLGMLDPPGLQTVFAALDPQLLRGVASSMDPQLLRGLMSAIDPQMRGGLLGAATAPHRNAAPPAATAPVNAPAAAPGAASSPLSAASRDQLLHAVALGLRSLLARPAPVYLTRAAFAPTPTVERPAPAPVERPAPRKAGKQGAS